MCKRNPVSSSLIIGKVKLPCVITASCWPYRQHWGMCCAWAVKTQRKAGAGEAESVTSCIRSSLFSLSTQVLQYRTRCQELEQQLGAGGVSVEVADYR